MELITDSLDLFGYCQSRYSRSHYNYILCTFNPKILELNRLRNNNLPSWEGFILFLFTIFYIGKGRNTRLRSHLYETRKAICLDNNPNPKPKLKFILNEMEKGNGILILRSHDGSTSFESHNREAAMLDGLTLENLTNINRGVMYGIEDWCTNKIRNYGIMLLYFMYKRYIDEQNQPIFLEELMTI